ncbi:MAG: magnesium transporter [Thermotogae bacterium]|nr:magnesium transporter [Thermotogota bacterium]
MFRAAHALLPEIRDLLKGREFRALKALLLELHPAEIEDIISELKPSEAVLLLKLLPPEKAAEVLSNLSGHHVDRIVSAFSDRQLLEIIEEMDDDDRVALFEELPPELVRRILSLLPEEEREVALTLLNYPEDSCGRLMNTEFIALNRSTTVRETLQFLRRSDYSEEVLLTIYAIDNAQRLRGQVKLTDIIKASDDVPIGRLAEKVPFVSAYDPAWKAAKIMADYDLLSIPVVDNANRMLGVITIDDVVDVIYEESAEDFLKFAAVSDPEDNYFLLPPLERIKKRLPWLAGLALLANISSMIIGAYEDVLKEAVILAAFIPILNGTAGNTGSQCASFVIRALATGEISPKITDVLKVWIREMAGVLMGLAVPLSAIAGGSAYLRTGDILITSAVALTMVVAVLVANSIGFFLPIMAKRVGIDPASISAPLNATLNDALTLTLYFTLSKVILHL